MRLNTSLVAVRKITATSARAEFPPEILEEAAQRILEAGALVTPLVVRRTGLESFELLAGDLAYHAAQLAREKNGLRGEMVLAFIAEDEHEAALLRQLDLFGAAASVRPFSPTAGSDLGPILARLEQHIEKRLETFAQRVTASAEKTDAELRHLAGAIPRPHQALEVFNDPDERRLMERLQEANLKGKTLDSTHRNILAARRKGGPFVSLKDVVARVEKLGEARLLSLVDAWSSTVHLSMATAGPCRAETSSYLQTPH